MQENLKLQCLELETVMPEHKNRMKKIAFETEFLAAGTWHTSAFGGIDLKYVMF